MTRPRKRSEKRARRAFSPEFKLETVRLMRERKALGVPLTQISRELDVRPNQLRAWARQVDERVEVGEGGDVSRSGPLSKAEAKLRRLQRENTVLRQERDFLKKAAAFFAKESR